MTGEDIRLVDLYAGLAVLAKDIDVYLRSSPRSDASGFEEVVAAVHQEEQTRYGSTAFPYDAESFPYKGVLDFFPKGLALQAANGQPTLESLIAANIRHEWTVKAGKRLFLKFGKKFQAVICSKDGPYDQFEHGLVGQAALPTTIATQILTAGVSAATLWYPLAVYIALLFVRRGLKTYCEPTAAPAKPAK